MRIGKLSRFLVMGEVAMSVGLLVTAGLMVKGMIELRTMEYGFDRQEVFTSRIGLFPSDFPDIESKSAFFRDLREGLEARPEVAVASISDVLPGLGAGLGTFGLEATAYPTDRDYPRARLIRATPGYFETFGVRPVQGRTFDGGDDREGLPVALVNQSFVRRFSPEEDVLGKRIRFGDSQSEEPWRTVVGVVPDLFMEGVGNDPDDPQGIYIPLAQADAQFVSIALRGRGEPAALASVVRSEVARHSPDTPIYWPRTMQEALNEQLWFVDLFGGMFAVFGFGALFLASVGLYGVTSFSVKQRTHEVGIRMALGARSGKVLGMVLRQGVVQILIGLTVGLGLGALLSTGLRETFTLVEPWDPSVFIGIAMVLLATGFLATLFPARRATRVDPVEALRDS
jgi:predicted permease